MPKITLARGRRRRAWWRFAVSLRMLMIAVLLIGGVLGWTIRRATVQRHAVAAIKAAGGMVAYDYEHDAHGNYVPGSPPRAPRWVREGLGDEFFQEVVDVGFGGPKIKPGTIPVADLIALANLGQLRRLHLYGVPLADASLHRLAELPSLETFESMQIGLPPGRLDALPSLRNLDRLKSFRICPSPTADAGLAFLRGVESLEAVDLRETVATDAGLAVLVELPKLWSVQLDGSRITDAGLALLGRMPTLITLSLLTPGRSAVYTDQGLAQLAKIPHLATLELDCTHITAAGWQALPPFGNLNWVALSGLRPDHDELIKQLARRSFAQIRLAGPGVCDAWLDHFAGTAGRLDWLELNEPGVTDAAVDRLVKFTSLRVLALDRSGLTDAGLLRLAAAPALRHLSVRGTGVTPAGIAAFRAANPAVLQVTSGPLP